ncbi:repulsive guidance molecule A-like isoform X2 [Ptychodera flava]|uniref:repulsive guidance molecule A-like isoform X2 n=1 Tax=Ptychodera flava TaxID=63121 RepID=UPI003969F743
MIARAYRAAKASEFPSARTVWKGMGRRRFCSSAVRLLQITVHFLILATLTRSVSSDCRVVKCSTEYSDRVDRVDTTAAERCDALRAYNDCAREMARACRGDLNYHSIVTLIPDLMRQYDCSNQSTPPKTVNPPGNEAKEPSPADNRCTSYNGRHGDYKHCGLFGDPHLRTFDNHFETCKVQGAWPLIDNEYIAVQVTNVPLVDSSSATATDKLTVIIKDHSECVEQKMYQAQTGNLPAAFVDGTNRTGPGRSLRIFEIEPRRHVEIHAKYIDTRIVVRQVGRYLTFAIRMPSDLVNTGKKDGLELCVKGCPNREKMDFQRSLPLPPDQIPDTSGIFMSKETAIAKCLEVNVTDFYFDSCVFDLMTTGDVNFTTAARKAQKDFWDLLPDARGHSKNQNPGLPTKSPNATVEIVNSSAPPRTTQSWTLTVYILLVQCTIFFL